MTAAAQQRASLRVRSPWRRNSLLPEPFLAMPTSGDAAKSKFKGTVLDAWVRDEFGTTPIRSVYGYNADEQYRVDRAIAYIKDNETLSYPLIQWNWNRSKTES